MNHRGGLPFTQIGILFGITQVVVIAVAVEETVVVAVLLVSVVPAEGVDLLRLAPSQCNLQAR